MRQGRAGCHMRPQALNLLKSLDLNLNLNCSQVQVSTGLNSASADSRGRALGDSPASQLLEEAALGPIVDFTLPGAVNSGQLWSTDCSKSQRSWSTSLWLFTQRRAAHEASHNWTSHWAGDSAISCSGWFATSSRPRPTTAGFAAAAAATAAAAGVKAKAAPHCSLVTLTSSPSQPARWEQLWVALADNCNWPPASQLPGIPPSYARQGGRERKTWTLSDSMSENIPCSWQWSAG